MSQSVFAIVKTRSQVERIVTDLQDSDIELRNISVLYPEAYGNQEIVHEKNTKAPEGAAGGAATGGVAGGVLGLLAGIGTLAIPGLGALIAVGPIFAALSGAAVGAAAGGLIGGLVGLGIPEIEARHYETKLREGNYFISVHADNDAEVDLIKSVFRTANAEDIGTTTEATAPAR